MKGLNKRRPGERGHMLLVVVFLATAIAGLAAISSSRVVSESRHQAVLENETRAYNGAYAQLHMALNVVNSSTYTDNNNNIALRDAINGVHGGTVSTGGTEVVVTETKGKGKGTTTTQTGTDTTTTTTVVPTEDAPAWMDDPNDPVYGFVQGTSVRVYRGRDYINRLARLKGDAMTEVDPIGVSDRYFVLEAAGRSGATVRMISALVRETQPFSSFVFFQNRATLGISGSPRGLIHANNDLAFYFPGGSYLDTVSSVNGFEYVAGATPANTSTRDANPSAVEINLEDVDFNELADKSDLFRGDPGLDADIHLQRNGTIKISLQTPPRYEEVEKSYTYEAYVGSEQVTTIESQQVQVGTTQVAYDVQVIDHYDTESYWEWENVKVGETTETLYRNVQVQTGTETVNKTREEPVYEEQEVTKTRSVKVWQSFTDTNAGGGTTVAGGADGDLGEWVWTTEEYQTTELVQTGTTTVAYTEEVPVYTTVQEAYTVTTPIYKKKKVDKTRQVAVYTTETRYRDEPVYESQDVEVTKTVNHYETVTETYTTWEFIHPTQMGQEFVDIPDEGGTIYIDGRIIGLDGQLDGRLTIVGNEKVRITGNIRYIDQKGKFAMDNGTNYTDPYVRNEDYAGQSVLGVVARDDIVFAHTMPASAELNGTIMSVNGRVGIDGFWADDDGELHKDSSRNRRKYLTEEERMREYAYDRLGYTKTKRFTGESLRRIGGIISNDRIMETYVSADKQGYTKVSAGYKRGYSKFDINMMYNPPPNFVEVPRPVVTAFVPVFLVRNNDE